MKQIVVISGKGGTGKTIVAASFAAKAEQGVFVDTDVDASNLHLLLRPQVLETHVFQTGQAAVCDKAACTGCGRCVEVCRFAAIDSSFNVDPLACEGCGLCVRVCPSAAIRMEKEEKGAWYVSRTAYGPFVHAHLAAGAENSGKLVTRVRQAAQQLAEQEGHPTIIIDGPPGIGCPVMASISGTDMAVVVTEPTLSGWHDAQRVMRVAEHFRVPVSVVINKYDLNEGVSKEIEGACRQRDIRLLGKIPFDKSVVAAVVDRKIPGQAASSAVRAALEEIWKAVIT